MQSNLVDRPLAENASNRGAVWVCYGAMMCLAIPINLPPLYLTTFANTFGLTAEQSGRVPAFIFGSLTVAVVICGPLADRWGAKLFVMLGLVLLGGGLVLMGCVRSYAMLLTSGCLMGFGVGILDMILSPIVSALQPDRRASAMNWLHSFYCTGALCTVLVGTFGLRMEIPWRAVFVVMVALPAVVIIGLVRVKIPPLVSGDKGREPVRSLVKHPFLLMAVAGIFLVGATEHGIVQWLPAFAEKAAGFTRTGSGMILLGYLAAMVLGRILVAGIGKRANPILIMLTCSVLSAALIAVACFCPYAPMVTAALIAVGMTGSCLWPTMLAVAADRFPRGGASMFAMLSASGNGGCLAMSWTVGVVYYFTKDLKWGVAAIIFCPLALAAALTWMRAQRPVISAAEYPAASASQQ